jgi:FkbM family methyltransferase
MIPNYEAMLECIYHSILSPGDKAIDVGAHVGRHTLPMAKAVGSAGKIFAFEPLPSIHKELSASLERIVSSDDMAYAPVTTYNFALGEDNGESEFVFVPEFPEYSGFKERTYHSDSLQRETIHVQVRKLDSFEAEFGRVRYIKVDAEGGELAILRGAKAIITKSRPIVSFELGDDALINYAYSAADYFDFFADLDYQLHSIFGPILSRDEFIEAARSQYFWDYIAVPLGDTWRFGHDHIRLLVDQLRSCDNRADVEFEIRTAYEEKLRIEHDAKLQALAEAKSAALAAQNALLASQAAHEAKMHAEARVSELLSSTSWRVTKPLRLLKNIVSGTQANQTRH